MGHLKQLLVLALFCSATLAGCIGPSSDESMIDLVVDLETTSGTVVETYLDGELVSLDAVDVSFDFSQTTSSLDLVKFGLDAMDGSEPMTIDASESSTLTHSFVEHGIHNVTLFAIDAAGTQNNQSASIRIDLRIEWSEQGTNEPMALPFNPTPNNGWHPSCYDRDQFDGGKPKPHPRHLWWRSDRSIFMEHR